jgi:parallel beta-helix repeat protein
MVLALQGGQAFAAHVRCGDVIKQDTTLDSDLVDCPDDGIVIGADKVTIDLAGHTIEGTSVYPRAGIDNDAGHAAVKIEHGRVEGFEYGVRLWRASDGRLRDLTVSDNRFGILLTDSHRNVIEGGSGGGNAVWVSLSGSDGNRIERNVLTGDGIMLSSSNDNRVVENVVGGIQISGDSADDLIARNSVTHSWRSGIYAAGSGHRIERNTITGSGPAGGQGSNGIELAGANARVVQNSVSHHDHGIYCNSSQSGNLIERNVVKDASRVGILTIGCHAARIERNKVFHNPGVGITLAATRSGHVERNLVADSRHGITFQDSSESRMERNIVVDSRQLGIDSHAGSDNWIVHNEVFRSGFAGVAVSDDRDRVEQNVIYDNGHEGLRVLREDNQVRGNVIHDNGGPGVGFGAMKVRIEGNAIFANGGVGIFGFMFAGAISQNTVVGNSGDGILFFDGPTSAEISRNRVHRNDDDGIDVDGPGARLSQNSANRNGELGIEAVAGVIDGGGNKAGGNGSSLQCVNIACR